MIRKQLGFSVLEVTVAFAVMGLLLVPLTSTLLNFQRQRMSNIAASEVLQIGEAAQNYRAEVGEWPDETNGCVGGVNELIAAGYIGGVGNRTVWDGVYATQCPGTLTFEIALVAPSQRDAESLQRAVPRATRVGANITSSFPRPGIEPALDQLLHRTAEPGRPELNRMQTDIDMDDNSINNIGTLAWRNNVSITSDASDRMRIVAQEIQTGAYIVADDFIATSMNRSLSQAVTELTVVDSGSVISLPNCPGGLTPRIYAWPHDLVPSTLAPPIHAWRVRAPSIGGNQVRVSLEVVTSSSGSWTTASNLSRLVVAPKCS